MITPLRPGSRAAVGSPGAAGAAVIGMLAVGLLTAAGMLPTSDPAGAASAPPVAAGLADGPGRAPTWSPEADTTPATSVTVVWARGRLDPAFTSAVADADGIVDVTRTRAVKVGLAGSVAADGTPRDVVRDGWRIPVTVLAVEPGGWVRHLGAALAEDDRRALARLGPGRVLLSESSARLRGLGAGARVDLGGGRELEVAGVVSDGAAAGDEFVVHVDEIAVDWSGGREALLVQHRADRTAALDRVVTVAAERASATSGQGVTRIVRRSDGDRVAVVLSQTEVKERFGEFAYRPRRNQRGVVVDPGFVDRWIVTERLPGLGPVRCHRLIMDDLRAAVEELIAAGHGAWLSPRHYSGCFNPRRIELGREDLSRHAWGIAIDLHVDLSQPGGGPVPPDAVIDILGRHGFRWGGDFSVPDNHHFEWVGSAAAVRPERPALVGGEVASPGPVGVPVPDAPIGQPSATSLAARRV